MSIYQKSQSVAALDVITNTLMGFIVLYFLSFILAVLAKEKEDEKKIDTSGEYLILVTWDNKSGDDVDTHVRDPQENHLYFNNREIGLMHLERDDRGKFNDETEFNNQGMPIAVDKNEEKAIIRGIVPGEYIINIHMFRKVDPTPTKVKIALIKLRGKDTTVVEKELDFPTQGEEQTAFRFTLKIDGSVTDINQLPIKFIGSALPLPRTQGGTL